MAKQVLVKFRIERTEIVENCYECPNYQREMGGGSCRELPSKNYQDIVGAHGIDRKCPFL